MKPNFSILALGAAATWATPLSAAPAAEKISTRVYMAPQCLITTARSDPGGSQFIGGLVAIVAPVLLGYVIDAVVANLQKVRKQQSSGSLAYDLYEYDRSKARYPIWNGRQGCVTVVTASGAPTQSKVLTTVASPTDTAVGAGVEDIKRRLSDNGITGMGNIYSVLEAELVYSEDTSAYRYVPRFYRLERLLPGNSSRTQGVAYTLSLLGPGATPNGTQYSSAVIEIGQASAPMVLDSRNPTDQPKLAGWMSGYVQRPGLTPASFAAFVRRSRDNSSPPLKLMPAVLRAELVQTQKPSDIAKFAAAILSGSKAGLVAAAGKELTPLDADDQRQKLLNAEVAIKTAEAELAAATAENNPSKIALAQAKLAAARDLRASLQ